MTDTAPHVRLIEERAALGLGILGIRDRIEEFAGV
jgi:hypothetical protein